MLTKNAKAHDASLRRFKLQFVLGVFDPLRIPITSAVARKFVSQHSYAIPEALRY